MKLACSTLACPLWSLETILERFPRYGYDGIEWRGLGAEIAVYKLPEFTTDADATRQKIAAAGLAVASFDSSARMFDAPDKQALHVEELRQYAALARRFGAPLVRVFGGALGGTSHKAAMPVCVDVLRRMSDAAGAEVTVAVETHDEWCDSAALADVLARADRPNVRALWDLHHPFRFAGESPEKTYRNLKPYLAAAHVKDSRMGPDGKPHYLPSGEGDVPLAEMLALMAQGGFDGWVSIEWEKRWHPDLADADVALPAEAAWFGRVLPRR